MKHIVKRAGLTESYDERKLYASIYAAALALREPVGSAELIANEVVRLVNEWLAAKHEVTSHDIRVQAAKHLKALNPDAGLIYLNHRIIC
jgi:transcriptional regulator NrdR family protein